MTLTIVGWIYVAALTAWLVCVVVHRYRRRQFLARRLRGLV